jgi:predicted phage-related endonuclease
VSIDRRTGIGASEVAALAGASPWTTPVAVWLRKVGLSDDPPDTNPMRMGRTLEAALLRALGDELGVRLVHNARTFTHPEWPTVPLFGTPDGFGPHRYSLAEIKVVGHRFDDWKGGPPEYVHLQVQAQMACYPKAQRVHVGALIGSELRTWQIDRDPPVIAALEEEVAAWWARYVVPEVSPDPEGPADTWALLRAQVSPEGRTERVAADQEAVLAAQLLTLLAHQDHLAEEVEERRRALAVLAQDVDLVGPGWRATWGARKSTDWRGVVEAERIPPAIVRRFERVSPTFTFRRSANPQESAP